MEQRFGRQNSSTVKFEDPKPVPGQINAIYQNKSLAGAIYMDSLRRIVLQEIAPDSDLRTRAPQAYDLHYQERMVKHLKTQGALNFATKMIRGEDTITPNGKFAIISENFGEAGKYGLGGKGDEDLCHTDRRARQLGAAQCP